MLKTLPRLLALQTCDQRIRETAHTLERLQASLVAVEGHVFDGVTEKQLCRATIREAKRERDALGAQRKQIQIQLREKRRSEHHRSPGKVKEFLQREIALLDAQKTAIEDELRTVEQRIADDTAILQQAEDGAPTLLEARLRSIVALREQIATTQAQLRAAQEERTGLTPDLPSFVVAEYERIFTHRSGVAVVTIAHEICQGCHLHVPAHICQELQKTPRFAFCPNCHRIVFVAPAASIVSVASGPPEVTDHDMPARHQRARVLTPKRKSLAASRESYPARVQL